ncbi:type II toxin-antitoxin system VapC family toxin [Pseudonocardia sp. K10HN5]|uniref:Type II toxin-antitoxin system VapC family toxin n=1 Tax=Pseudonocardia acidicola TaxID=2724939 RepID=A0ABX1SD05_9PSEU|nr:type II toxin-antitoxin system VapC family toxin [Pseudonocardia acidicola]
MLDASAVLAWLRAEPGAEAVHPLLGTAVISAANWSETWQKLAQHGVDADRATTRLRTLGLRVEPVTAADAVTAAQLWARTRAAGLSLGDRCCLALGARLQWPAVTADTAWAGLDLDDITVQVIR